MSNSKSGIWTWGWNPHGQLGHGDRIDHEIPKYLPFMHYVADVSCGNHHCALVTNAGELYSWGDGGFGKLGHGDTADQFAPKKVKFSVSVKMVKCATAHTMALASDGSVYSWGSGYFGTLGHGDGKVKDVPTLIVALKGVVCVRISAGGNSSGAIAQKNAIYVWGYNKVGQLGIGTNMDQTVPKLHNKLMDKIGSSGICKLEVGDKFMAALTNNGDVYTWGSNAVGQLGYSGEDTNEPKKVRTSQQEKIVDISLGPEHVAVVSDLGYVYTWGCAADGRLGHIQTIFAADGKKSYSVDLRNLYAPKQVEAMGLVDSMLGKDVDVETLTKKDFITKSIKNIVKVQCGGCHTAALDTRGRIWCWGSDKHGQLGFRDATALEDESRNVAPRLLESLIEVNSIVCGGYHTMAITCGPKNIALQLARDNECAELQKLFFLQRGLASASIVDPSNGFTMLHWAAALGHDKMIGVLLRNMELREALSAKDFQGRTALHLCTARGDMTSVKPIVYVAQVSELSPFDNTHSTPLHVAVQKHHLDIASLLVEHEAPVDILDSYNRSPLFYCQSFKDSFALKEKANKHDVTIVHEEDSIKFAYRLLVKIEQDFVKCFLPHVAEQERRLDDGVAVIFVVSEKSANSERCLSALRKAKQLGKPILAIWANKVKLPHVLESLIFRHQLVDFTVDEKFNDSASQLISGLKNTILKGEKDDVTEEVEGEPDKLDTAAGEHTPLSVFVSYDATDEVIGSKLVASITNSGIQSCFKATTSLQNTTKQILNSCVFVVIMSEISLKSKKVRDQIAIAENHKKPLLPVFLNPNLKLDPATQYTFATSPRYYADNTTIQQLISSIKVHQRITELNNEMRESNTSKPIDDSGGSAGW